jgi:hypothetical protein
VIKVLVGVDQIFHLGAAGEFECFLDFVDPPNVGIDENGAPIARLNYPKVGCSLGANHDVEGATHPLNFRFHFPTGISDWRFSCQVQRSGLNVE